MIRISHKLEPFISNKRVAIVGGADHMLHTGLGSKIDSYDTVVRVNLHWPSPRAYMHLKKDATEDIGCRTDVLIVTESIWKEKLFVFENLKHAILIVQSCGENINSMIRTFSAMDVDFDLMLSRETNNIVKGSILSTGLVAMKLVLDANPSELFVTGYDFFTQSSRGWKTHNPVIEKEYFRDKILTQDRVTAHTITEYSCRSKKIKI